MVPRCPFCLLSPGLDYLRVLFRGEWQDLRMFSVVVFSSTEKFQIFMTLRQEEEGACEDEEGRKRKSCGSALHYRELREHDLCDRPLWTGARVITDGETHTPCRLQSEPVGRVPPRSGQSGTARS